MSQKIEKCQIIYDNKKFEYVFKRANRKGAPIIIIFHGHSCNSQAAKFSDDKYNIICPIDNYGYNHMGSWWLGEHNNFFWINVIEELIKKVQQETKSEDTQKQELYFWGSSMGGYAAILYGYIHNATGVYANIPQTLLYGSQYANYHMTYWDYIFDGKISKYNNLSKFINSRTDTFYYLTFAGLENDNYIKDQCFPLIYKLQKLRTRFYLELLPTSEHKGYFTIAETMEKLFYIKERKF